MQFVDPPPEARGERTKRWEEIVAMLRAHRGEWALVGNFSPGIATAIRRGKYKAFLDGVYNDEHLAHLHMKQHWEVTTRKTDDGKRNDVYVRWLG